MMRKEVRHLNVWKKIYFFWKRGSNVWSKFSDVWNVSASQVEPRPGAREVGKIGVHIAL